LRSGDNDPEVTTDWMAAMLELAGPDNLTDVGLVVEAVPVVVSMTTPDSHTWPHFYGVDPPGAESVNWASPDLVDTTWTSGQVRSGLG